MSILLSCQKVTELLQLFEQTPVFQALMPPGRKICGRMKDFRFSFLVKFCHLIRATRGTQPASDTAFQVHDSHPIPFGDRSHLASLYTGFTANAFIRINNGEITGGSH